MVLNDIKIEASRSTNKIITIICKVVTKDATPKGSPSSSMDEKLS